MFGRRVLLEHECAVVFGIRGPLLIRGPGAVWTLGRRNRPVMVDLRPFTVELPTEEALTKDQVRVTVSGRLRTRVVDPMAAATKVVDYRNATEILGSTVIRAVLKKWLSDDLRSTSAGLEASVFEEVRGLTPEWGVAVDSAKLEWTLPEDSAL